MENGDWDTAESEKQRLEQNQRERKKERGKGDEPPPNYFTKHVIDEKKGMYWYEYGTPREYWKDRKSRDWDHLTDLYGNN